MSEHVSTAEHVEPPDDVEPIQPEDVLGAYRGVIDEINAGLASPKWSLILRGRFQQAELLAAAALRHCEALASEMLLACERGAQHTVRLLGRSFLEAWLTGMYLHYGGGDAFDAVLGNYEAAVRTNQSAADLFDAQLAARKKQSRKSKCKVDKANEAIDLYNEEHPEAPRRRMDEVVIPTDVPLQLDMHKFILAFTTENPVKLSVHDMVSRIRKLSSAAGREESYESVYQYAYRSLSVNGAHPTINVLLGYVKDGFFRTVGTETTQPDSNEAVQMTTLLLLAHMVKVIFEKRDVDHSYSTLVMRRFDAAQRRSPHSTRSEVLGSFDGDGVVTPKID